MRCEICDREPAKVSRAADRFDSPSYPAMLRGGGHGYAVPFRPPHEPWQHFDAAPLEMGRTLKAWAIWTCGDPVCIFRARRHGVPGYAYSEAAA